MLKVNIRYLKTGIEIGINKKPKIKITIGLHLLSLSKNIFSTAIKTIDKAISVKEDTKK